VRKFYAVFVSMQTLDYMLICPAKLRPK
jgi:hypothetical protein